MIAWHDGSFAFRWNDPKTGCSVIVMQRLHEHDLSGHVLERGNWTHLCLPARYERRHPFVWPDDPRSTKASCCGLSMSRRRSSTRSRRP